MTQNIIAFFGPYPSPLRLAGCSSRNRFKMASSLQRWRTRLHGGTSSLHLLRHSGNVNVPFFINQRTLAFSQHCLNEEPSSHNHKRSKETIGESRLQKFRNILRTFISGSRLLGHDVKRMVQIQRKLKESNYDWNVLATEEILLLNQTRKDLIKTLPAVAVFFTVPFFGYAAPVIAFLYPKHLLSHHYWQPHQTEKYIASDARKRKLYYLSLVREVGRSVLEKKKNGQRKELLRVCGKTINKAHPTNDELLRNLESFSNNSLSLDQLPKYHLKKLSRALLVSPPWLPGFVLRARIRRHLNNIKKEDAALKREGVCQLNEVDLKKVCHSRGLDTAEIDTEGLVGWLTEWIELSDAASGKDESFLAHSAVFKSINYKRIYSEGEHTVVDQ